MISAPKAPDPYATAQAQATMNKQTAISQQVLNMVNQNTPDGTLRYAQTGMSSDGTPMFTATTTLSDAQQGLYNTNQATQQNLANIGNQQSQMIGNLLNNPFQINQGDIDARTAGMPQVGVTQGAQTLNQTAAGQGVQNAINGASSMAGASTAGPQVQATGTNQTGAASQIAPSYTAAPGQQSANLVNAPDKVGVQNTAAPDAVASRYTAAPGQIAGTTTAVGQQPGVQATQAPGQVQTQAIAGNDQLAGQLFGAAMQRYMPNLAQSGQDLQSQLAAQGLTPGSTGYDAAMRTFGQNANDLMTQTFLQGQNQAFNQAATRNAQSFDQRLQSSGQAFNQNLAANNQNFNQGTTAAQNTFNNTLAANNQNFNQAQTSAQNAFNNNLQANAQNYGMDTTSSQNAFNNNLAANNQNFNQATTSTQNDFSNKMSAANQNFGQTRTAQQDAFSNNLAANNQNYQQASDSYNNAYDRNLAANNQNFNQNLAANNQKFSQNNQAATFQAQQQNDIFNRLSSLAQLGMSQQQQDYTQQSANNNYKTAQEQYNANLGMSQRQQAITEALQQRQEPIQELSQLLGTGQVSQPKFTATPQATVQPADLTGLVASNYQAKMQGYSGMLSGLASLGGSLLKAPFMSDARLKRDVSRVGTLPSGLGVYRYRYTPESGLDPAPAWFGVMAQEVQAIRPHAVVTMPNGFLAVDYSQALAA